EDAVTIEELSYKEIIEMAYYGAQVIHPKTIKPLQNKNIPLFVKPFLDLRLAGTVISSKPDIHLPSMIVNKQNQVLITLQTIDFSFVEGKPTSYINSILNELNIKPNLTQNTAISLMICVNGIYEKIEETALRASAIFDVQIQKDLQLLTIRHYSPEIVERLSKGKEIILEQKTKETIQMLISNNQ